VAQQQVQQLQITESTKRMQYILEEMEGIANQLLASPHTENKNQGKRLMQVMQKLDYERQTIHEIVNNGRPYVSQAEKDIGSKVQEAIQGASQI
jgi:mevalonate kinase